MQEASSTEPSIVELARQAAQAYHEFVESELRSLRDLFCPNAHDTSHVNPRDPELPLPKKAANCRRQESGAFRRE